MKGKDFVPVSVVFKYAKKVKKTKKIKKKKVRKTKKLEPLEKCIERKFKEANIPFY
jgi:hypothetical protein